TQNNTNSATNVTYSLFQGGYSGTGNINADPLFVDRAANDYHLGAGSECIDKAGTAAENPVIDLDGKTRPDGSGFDMGCYEF
ncbi:MAG TPA: choice-of-anchor Q domain-containing protein, partial [bacterium]|nr:choice-of-anchor Q domain-containing protein [bacterium]